MEKHGKTKQFRGKSRRHKKICNTKIYHFTHTHTHARTRTRTHTHTIVLKTFFENKNSGNLLVQQLGQYKCNDWDNNKFVVQALGRTRFSSFRLFFNKFWEFSKKFAL